jgi:thiaminase
MLRASVEVLRPDGAVLLRHGFWETSLPSAWVEATAGFASFLARKLAIDELVPAPGLPGVRQLLEAQGCLTNGPLPELSRLRDVCEAFAIESTIAYGRYYRHPIWRRIRDGDEAALMAWLAHNLQLSRSVGQTAARAATRSRDARARAVFLRNAIEEYDHFERYFKVEHPVLGVSATDFSRAVPGPATLSFTLQMLHMAENDWLGHTLTAWFQERTARYARQAKEFYAEVEASTGLRGLFLPWLEHVGYDLTSKHEDSFSALLERDEWVERSELERALRNASFAVHHLLRALDEIAAPPAHASSAWLRMPPVQGSIDPSVTRLLDAWPGITAPVTIRGSHLALVVQRCLEAGILRGDGVGPASADSEWIAKAAARAAVTALGHAVRDEDILACGALVEALCERKGIADEWALPRTPACMAAGTFLLESARSPPTFLLALRALITSGLIADAAGLASLLDRYLESVPVSDIDEVLIQLVHLGELALACRRESAAPPRDVFSG